MKRKVLILLLVVAMLVPMFAACGDTAGTPSEAPSAPVTDGGATPEVTTTPHPEALTIQWWNSWTSNDGNVMRELVDYYNENNKDNIFVSLDIVVAQALTEKITASLLSNTAPELYNGSVSSEYSVNGQLVPIDDIWEKTKLQKDDFYEDVLKYCYWNDTLYSIPFQLSGYFFFYNTEIFDRAGIAYDGVDFSTWEDTFECGRAVNALGDVNIIPGGMYTTNGTASNYFMASYGAEFMSGDSLSNFQSELGTYSSNILEALNLIKGAYDEGVWTRDVADQASSFRGGQCAFQVDGAWLIIGSIENNVPFDLNVVPGGPAGRFVGGRPSQMVLLKGNEGERKDATYKFIEYWNDNLSEDRIREKPPVYDWSSVCGYQSYLKSVNEDPELLQDPRFLKTRQYTDYIKENFPFPVAMYRSSHIQNNILNVMYQSVIHGTATAESALQIATTELEALLEELR